MATKNDITQEYLKQKLSYDSATGDFIWVNSKSRAVKNGSKAGTLTSSGYSQINIEGNYFLAHRLAWLYVHGHFPEYDIDHINGKRCDNRITNLRSVSREENGKNKRVAKNNKTNVPDVVKKGYKWYSRISCSGKRISLYHGDDFFEAVCARKSAEIKYEYHKNHGRLL